MEMFTGNYEAVINKTVFLRQRGKYIPCLATNYYFKDCKFALVPIEDIEKYPDYNQAHNRRVFYKKQIFVPCTMGG